MNVEIGEDVAAILNDIYFEARKHNPNLTKKLFIEGALIEWLDLYKYGTKRGLQRDKVELKTKLQEVIKICGSSQSKLAKEIGINRCYLGRVARGESDPSITMALLILDALGYPPQRFTDVFYLEPMKQE